MYDWWNAFLEKIHLPDFLKTALDHWRWSTVGVILSTSVVGCNVLNPPTVESPVTQKQVTRVQLETEVSAWNVTAEAKKKEFEGRFSELTDKEARRAGIFNAVVSGLGTTAVGASPIFAVALGILSAFFGVDNLRKNQLITTSAVTHKPIPAAEVK